MRSTVLELDVARSFAADVKDHLMIVALDQGLYRHLVFQRRESSWNNRFDLITAPGLLTITGDRGSYTFRRLVDMFQFFRCNPDQPHRINVSYWAEKLYDVGRSVQTYSEEYTRQLIKEHLDRADAELAEVQKEFNYENERLRTEWLDDLRHDGIENENDPEWVPFEPEDERHWPELIAARDRASKAREVLADAELYGRLGDAEGARETLRELERVGLMSDTWEFDLTDFDYHFVWCLHAIAWGIQQYDKAVRDGLHKRRTGPVAWDTPLPTTAPAKPDRKELPQISFEQPAEQALPSVQPQRPRRSWRPLETADVTGAVL